MTISIRLLQHLRLRLRPRPRPRLFLLFFWFMVLKFFRCIFFVCLLLLLNSSAFAGVNVGEGFQRCQILSFLEMTCFVSMSMLFIIPFSLASSLSFFVVVVIFASPPPSPPLPPPAFLPVLCVCFCLISSSLFLSRPDTKNAIQEEEEEED